MTLITIDHIAKTLNQRREYVRDRLVKRPDFPRPALVLSQKVRQWDAADFEAWLKKMKWK
jgi:predicted DNA-binding transcriptional regulator AlpA